jgi:alpha-tubulin suppressor-like RCC1 family protein
MQALNPYGPGRLTEYDTGNEIYSGAELWGWGRNLLTGRIGDNSAVNRSSPVQVGALTDWKQVSVGQDFSTAIKTDGTLWSWGAPEKGKLGQNNTSTYRSSPVQVGSLTDWHQISSAGQQTAAVKVNGTMWAWGYGSGGRLGDNTTISRSSPVQIGSLTDWAQVSMGGNASVTGQAIALKTNGTIWTWGTGTLGRLGLNSLTYRSSPVQVGLLTNWAQVSSGTDHMASIKTDGTLWAWGSNGNGQIGDGTVVNKSSPVQIGSLTNWSQVSAGSYGHTSAIKKDGTLWTWGGNSWGQGARGNVAAASSPVQVGALTNWSQVSAGYVLNTFVKTNGTLWSCGRNENGSLGANDTVQRSSPIQIGSRTGWASVSSAGGSMQGAAALYGVV